MKKHELFSQDGELRHKIYYDDENELVRIVHYDNVTADDARFIVNAVSQLLEGKQKRYMLDDATRMTLVKMDKETRNEFSKAQEVARLDKIAMFGANPMTRMIAKVVGIVTGNAGRSRFFRTEEEALHWLKEG